jgi:hypothetical protein
MKGAAMADLYDRDVVAWSEQQAALLRRRAAGELVNDAELDWPNIAEEIEDVGNEQRNALESLLTNIMQHRLQIDAWPQAPAVPHWHHEIDGWRVQVRRRLRRSPKLGTVPRRGGVDLPRGRGSATPAHAGAMPVDARRTTG